MKIGVIGLGLIGASLARGWVKSGREVLGWDLDPEVMSAGKDLAAYTEVLTKQNAKELDMLVVALTPQATVNAWKEWAPYLRKGTVVCDIAGTKRYVVEQAALLAEQYPHLYWICTHPMAGREYSGIKHSQVGLFDKSTLLVVPVAAPKEVVKATVKLFLELGFGKSVYTTAPEHDRIIAFTSQLAHIVSNAYILSETATEQRGFSAGSFRDMTRVARINAPMWSELFVENRDHLVPQIDELIAHLTNMRDAIQSEDRATIEQYLKKGNARKILADRQNRGKD